MDYLEISQELVDFIQNSPSMFHSCETISLVLEAAGFSYLNEGDAWQLEKGGKYYTTRNGSSLIAFTVGQNLSDYHFQLTASHSDSPSFKIKSVPILEGPGEYIRLNVEAYGGMIDASWFDRPLGIAGRVLVREDGKVVSKLLHIEDDVLIIPNVAIHMNRKINDGFSFNRQVDLCPLFSTGELKSEDFDRMIAEYLGIQVEDILSSDLFVVNHQAPSIWGFAKEFVSTPKLDDLQCAYAALKAFVSSENDETINVYACFDNEEVGSNTKQGAMSTFLYDSLQRINSALGYTSEDYYRAVAKSFLVSCDNGHAVHPNHGEMADDGNRSYMNKGIVLKEAANQKYTTDAFSRAVFKEICHKAQVPYQYFANRSNMAGGSTLGNLSNIQVSLHALDIGLPQLAMHSAYETCGSKDTLYAVEALTQFYNSTIKVNSAFDFSIN
ncbi:M18 family aminopeptidase [Atopobacter sp. AH10]|uniref:M18 family aminopeptidase n=1 Tax=Atopobacter sp. AH10 TaxID=2315861 RepID=UPI000EF2010D|nr:M18 family aminopeptidase [Atopobacter sp. AH10]RLK63089.1 M18 family aminopeptidase [Atopobacter sp. AH10]